MTEQQLIEEMAATDAKDNFEVINEYLEDLKLKIRNFKIKDPDKLVNALALLSAGFFLGTRVNPKIRWLVSFLSGGLTGLLTIETLVLRKRETKPVLVKDLIEKQRKEQKPEEKEGLKNVKFIDE